MSAWTKRAEEFSYSQHVRDIYTSIGNDAYIDTHYRRRFNEAVYLCKDCGIHIYAKDVFDRKPKHI